MNNLDKLPARIKYYLLDWKDNNLEEYTTLLGNRGLHQLSNYELYCLYSKIVEEEKELALKILIYEGTCIK